MFTGIVETLGEIVSVEWLDKNIQLWIQSDFIHELKIDQSIAHNGICLTIDTIEETKYRVTAIDETIQKTNLNQWKLGQKINLERCLTLAHRIDGHIVQGHVESKGICTGIESKNGSTEFTFQYPIEFAKYLIEKGSICIDGISLTCHTLIDNTFKVSIIPYTLEHTNASQWEIETIVNLEFDIIGKYIYRNIELNNL